VEQGQKRNNPRAEHARRQPGRRRDRHLLTVWTATLMQAMFGDVGADWRDLPHIARLIRLKRIERREGRRTVRTDRRMVIGDLVDLVRGGIESVVTGMPELAASRATTRRLGRTRWCRWRIG
jgi:hypothetical protein